MDFEQFIKKYEMHYEIASLMHQQGKKQKEIGDQFNLSATCINQKYKRFLHALYKYYIQYLKCMQVKINERDLYDFYRSLSLCVAFFEKTYNQYLDSLRCGIPPIIFEKHMNIPTFRNLTAEKILELEKYIIEAREKQRKSYFNIGKELELSKEKAKYIYDFYYHKKILKAYERIRPIVDFSVENYIFSRSYASYKRWELIVEKYAELVDDLID